MGILKSRHEYKKLSREEKHSKECRLCKIKKQHVIKSFKNWTWVFSEFPYYKYHTMLVPKSHILRFHQLNNDEILELLSIIKEIEFIYKKSGVIGKKSKYGTQLLIFWRSRYWAPDKKFVEHLHMHFCPEFGGAWDTILDDNAHEIDLKRIRV